MALTEERKHDFFRLILDAIPSPVFVVDEDIRIIEFNDAAAPLLNQNPDIALRMRTGEALNCIHSAESPDGCGRGDLCRDCVIRNSVKDSFSGKKVSRRTVRMELARGRSVEEKHILVTTSPFGYQDQHYTLLILEDVSELVELRRVIPICANCKRIRNDQEYWEHLEAYFKSRLDLDFSHGICPDCLRRLYPDLYSKLPREDMIRSQSQPLPPGSAPPKRKAD